MPRKLKGRVARNDDDSIEATIERTSGRKQKTTTAPRMLDLTPMDEAFGPYADLYSDVLHVSVAATHEQIQLAYFDRRSELFTLLAKLDAAGESKVEAERRMDSVVLAVRILGDPSQRQEYDSLRQERLLNRRRAQHGQLPGTTAQVGAGLDSRGPYNVNVNTEQPDDEKAEDLVAKTPPSFKREKQRSKRKGRKSSKKNEDVEVSTPDTEHMTDEDEDQNIQKRGRSRDRSRSRALNEEEKHQDVRKVANSTSYDDQTSVTVADEENADGMLSCITHSRILRKIGDEISGACEDTLVSMDQVVNAFTLTDKDIRAVTKRIDKAKKQLDN